MTLVASPTDSAAVFRARRPARPLQSRWRREAMAAIFPWFLFFAVWLLLFPAQNSFDEPAHAGEEQVAADLAQDARDGNAINRFVVVTLGVVGGALLISNRRRLHLYTPIFVITILFFAWCLLSATWADDPAITTRRLISLSCMVLFVAGCAARMNPDILTVFVAGIPLLNLIPGVAAEVTYTGGALFHGDHRFGGTAPHPNVQAATLALSAILLSWAAACTSGARRVRFAAMLGVVVVFLFWTGSRTSILAVFICLAFSALLRVARDSRRTMSLLLAAMLLLAGCAGMVKLAFFGTGADPYSAFQRPGEDGDTLNGRVKLWKELLEFVARRPLTGYGYGGFWTAKRIEVVSSAQGWAIQQSHSAYMEQLLALGTVGLGLYLAMLFVSLWICVRWFFKGRNAYGAWAAVFLFIAIHDATEAINVTPLFSYMAFNMFVFSLGIAAPRATAPVPDLALEAA